MSILLLDTNLWSYLSQETDADALAAVFSASGHKAVICPHMLTEALHTNEVPRRTAIIEMMSSRHWRKLRSITDTQSEELTAEVQRLRPEWLRSRPKTDRIHSMRTYWTKVYWREAKSDPNAVVNRVNKSDLGDADEAAMAIVQAANKAEWPFEAGDLASAALSACMAEDHPDPDPGSRLGWPAHTPVFLWRVNARDVWWAHMSRELSRALTGYGDDTLQTFLGAYVDLPTMRRDRSSFNRFFLFDLETWNVPRTWWHGTVEVLQLGTKLAASNGADAAHASYLPDCDYLLTTDRRFADALQAAADTVGAPTGGAAVLVRHNRGGWLSGVQEALANLPPLRSPSPVRVITTEVNPRIGDGPGEVSASDVRRNTARGQMLAAIDGEARLLAIDGAVVADRVQVAITRDVALRPEGLKSEYFGAMRVMTADGPIVVGTKYLLEWTSGSSLRPTRIWVGEVAENGMLATFAVNSRL